MTPFASPRTATWSRAPSEPPDVSATPQARVLSWDTWQQGPATFTIGCFGFELGGYSEELAPIVFERLEPFVVRAAGGREGPRTLAPSSNADPNSRWQTLRFATPGDGRAEATLAFAFQQTQLRACFAVCRAPADESTLATCRPLLAEASFSEPTSPLPPPSLAQRGALIVLGHPEQAGWAFMASIGLAVLALLFARRVRFR